MIESIWCSFTFYLICSVFGTLVGIIVALMYGECVKLPSEYGFNTLLLEVFDDVLFAIGGIWNGGSVLVDVFVTFFPCIDSNCLTEIIPFCACPLPVAFDCFVDAVSFGFNNDGCAANPAGTIEQNCSYCERKLLLLVVALFRINSAYFESKSFVTPAMPRPPNDAGIVKLLVVAFFFGLFVAFSGCIMRTGFKLGIGLLCIALDVGIILNDFGKSCGKFGLTNDDKSAHIFFG